MAWLVLFLSKWFRADIGDAVADDVVFHPFSFPLLSLLTAIWTGMSQVTLVFLVQRFFPI